MPRPPMENTTSRNIPARRTRRMKPSSTCSTRTRSLKQSKVWPTCWAEYPAEKRWWNSPAESRRPAKRTARNCAPRPMPRIAPTSRFIRLIHAGCSPRLPVVTPRRTPRPALRCSPARPSSIRPISAKTRATLSTDTGGKAFFDLGDLSDAFPAIQRDNGGYYLVGYNLGADVKHDGRWRAIRVKVNVPGAHVRYRDGYYAPRDFQHLEKEDRDQQLADAINSDHPVVELPVAVETGIFRLSATQAYVPIAAKIAASALDWAQKHNKQHAEFDFAVEVRAVPSSQIVAQLRDTITVNLDAEHFEQVRHSNLLYQGGLVLARGNYRLKFVARENESGKIGTFEQNLVVPAAQPEKVTLSSVLLSSQLVPIEKSSEVATKGQGVRAKITSSPLDMEGQRIIPSVTNYFTQGQTLYVFLQAYYPEKAEKNAAFDPQSLRAGLVFLRNGIQMNATPLISPTQVDAKTHTVSFRISLPLQKLPTGRYTVQVVAVAPGTQHSAFGRAYLALQQTPAATAPSP